VVGIVAADGVPDVVNQTGQLETEVVGVAVAQDAGTLQTVREQVHRIAERWRCVEDPVERRERTRELVDVRKDNHEPSVRAVSRARPAVRARVAGSGEPRLTAGHHRGAALGEKVPNAEPGQVVVH
jgi:hypothetical protein